jgi:hypothetical protein
MAVFKSCGSSETLRAEFNKLVADVAALRAAIVGITAQLDGENVTNLDTDYAANNDPAAQTSANLTAS